MTKILDKQRLDEIRSRADAATEGPWLKGSWSGRCYENHTHGRDSCNYKYTLNADQPCISLNKDNVTLIGWDEHGTVLNDKNSTFIAHSRTDIPELLESHEQLRELYRINVDAVDRLESTLRDERLQADKIRALLEDAIFIIKDIGIAPDPINAKHDCDFLIKARDAGFE